MADEALAFSPVGRVASARSISLSRTAAPIIAGPSVARIDTKALDCGSRAVAQAPKSPAAPKAAGAIQRRRSEAVPTLAPSRPEMTRIMVTRKGLSDVPSWSMPARTRNPGRPSMNTSPTAATGDGIWLDSPAASSVSARARAALSNPATPARRRTWMSSITDLPR